MNKDDKELISEKFKGVYLHQQSNFDLISEKLEQIHKQTLLTNGRITIVEKQTKVIRFLESNPKISIVIFLGIYFLSTIFNFKDLINFLK